MSRVDGHGDVMLIIRDLWKTYPDGTHALRGVTLTASPGMYGLLGPNGAGKSTLMKILATLIVSDKGSARLHEIDVLADRASVRLRLGYLPQDFGFHAALTAENTLEYFARLKGISNRHERAQLVHTLLERVNLDTERRREVGGFSGGMRQRLGIAVALIGSPSLLIVDEPTAGLDPAERARVHSLLSDAAASGAIVVLSTHIVSDVADTCGTVTIMQRGAVAASCEPGSAIASLNGAVWETTIARDSLRQFASTYQMLSAQRVPDGLRIRVKSEHGSPGPQFEMTTPTLEDYYFAVTGWSAMA